MDISALPLLSVGAHKNIKAGMCVMEAVAFVAGEQWSDMPQCACPVIAAFLRSWNDALPDDERNAILRPFITCLIGTKADAKTEYRRAIMAADWLLRVHVPAWLRLAGLTGHADALASLPEIADFAQCPSLMPTLGAARDAAWAAAWAADWAVAWAVAKAAAKEAAWSAAWSAARDAAEEAAGEAADAVRDAAWDAVWAAATVAAKATAWAATTAATKDAARDALNDTRTALQKSALGLVNRMIDAR